METETLERAAEPHSRHRRERELTSTQQQQALRMLTDLLRGRHRVVVFTSDGVQLREEVSGARIKPQRSI